MAWEQWSPYVPVAERRRRAKRKMDALRKKGVDIQPVEIEGRKIAKTFWGEAWCNHLESFSDYANRLPRGRTYVRNGSVCHLAITKGKVEAKVSGSSIYSLNIRIKPLPKKKWNSVKQQCGGHIGSLIELLQGSLSDNVMEVVTDRKNGLFPLPREISLDCNCPDWAVMCKHVAAALYGVGARLDERPELLFRLRGVNHEELIDADAESAVSAATTKGKSKRLDTGDLSDVFGVDIVGSDTEDVQPKVRTKKAKKKAAAKRTKKKRASNRTTQQTAKKKAAKKKAVKRKTAKKRSTKAGEGTAAKRKTVAKKASRKGSSPKRSAKKKPGNSGGR